MEIYEVSKANKQNLMSEESSLGRSKFMKKENFESTTYERQFINK